MRYLVFLQLFISSFLVADPIKVITSTTDLAWAVREIGGDKVSVTSLLKGHENPHYVDAVPEFIRLAAEAKAAFVVGLDLEIGWMPKVLARSGNASIQPGGVGYCEVAKAIAVLEKPVGAVDRSMGDVHPSGNPHFWLSPTVFAEAAGQIANTLGAVDPANTMAYQQGLQNFKTKMAEVQKRSNAKLAPLIANSNGPVLIEYHKEFAYFMEAYKLKSYGSIEEKPGVTPSAGRLAELATGTKASGVKFALASDTAPRKTLERFSEMSGIPVVIVPMSITPQGKVPDYDKFQDNIVDSIATALKASAKAVSEGKKDVTGTL